MEVACIEDMGKILRTNTLPVSLLTFVLFYTLKPNVGVLVDTMTTEDDDFDIDDDDKLNNNLRRQQQQMQLAAEQGRRSIFH